MNIKNIAFAGLLHDIGKFYQRTEKRHSQDYEIFSQDDYGRNGAHGKWSADFVNSRWNSDIEDLVLYHHNYSKSKDSDSCKLVTKADHHSSSERISSEDNQDKLKEPLISIFSRVALKDNLVDKSYVPLKELSLNRNSFDNLKPSKNKPMEGWKLSPEYNELWNNFTTEIDSLRNLYDFKTILSLVKKYTSTVPSAVYKSEADISLFDHLKTTSALAVCRGLFKKDSNTKLTLKNDQEVYLAINGDLSGIQKFIYKVLSPQEAQSGMSKRLRGRSIYLTLFCEALVNSLISSLNLTEANILFCGGGRFTIMAPNTRNTLDILMDFKKQANKFLIDKFNGELYLSLVYEVCSGDDLGDFGKITQRLSNKLTEDKKHKFIDNLEDVFEIEEEINYDKICPVCGNKIVDDSKFCSDCLSHSELGKIVANSDYMIMYHNDNEVDKPSIFFEPLNIGFKFKKSSNKLVDYVDDLARKVGHLDLIKLNDTNFLDISKDITSENVSFSFSYLGNTVPKTYNNMPLYFEHLAQISKGASKLGILKMDVDDLGKLFSEGFNKLGKGASISRVSSLSSYLEIFFSGIINEIAKNYRVFDKVCDDCKDNLEEITLELQLDEDDLNNKPSSITVYKETNEKVCKDCEKYAIPTIHINYSGGDDLLVLGPYDDIIMFAEEFRNKFKQWTSENPSINISGGISIVGPKFPIGKGADLADEFLELSKDCGKDSITLFGEILKWNTNDSRIKGFDDLFKFGNNLEYYVEHNKVSKGFVYSLLHFWESSYDKNHVLDSPEKWKHYQLSKIQIKKFVPLFKYKLRLIKDKKIKEDLDKNGLKYMPWINIPVSWVSLRMR